MTEGIKMASTAVETGALGLGGKATPLKLALLPHPLSNCVRDLMRIVVKVRFLEMSCPSY